MNLLFDAAVYLIFLAICLVGIKVENGEDKKAYLTKLNTLRGIFALEIVVGHVIRFDSTFLYPLGKFMIISVAFFFFVSAFGMACSFERKPNYLDGFLIAKPLYLVCLIVFMYLFNSLVDLLCPMNLGYLDFSQYSFFRVFFEETNWYMMEQSLFYVLFYFVYKYVPRYRVAVIAVFAFVFMTTVYLCGSSEGWYASSMAFPMGLLFGECFTKIQGNLKKPYMWAVTVVCAILGLSSLVAGENLLGMVYLRNIMCIAGVLIVFYVATYLHVGNAVTRWLGKYSTEIYLFQFVYLKIADQVEWDYKIRIIFVVAATLVTARVMHPIFEQIHNVCLQWSKK